MVKLKNILDNLHCKLSRFFTATRVFVLGYALIIFAGAALLSTPIAMRGGSAMPFINALFTAVSATCVTGLSVIDTALDLSVFGQVVLLLLIQVGGLGFMTLSSSVYLMIGKKISLRNKIQLITETSENNLSDLKHLVKRIVIMTFVIEFAGFVFLSVGFAKYYNPSSALWMGLFHSVSSFCNAGFDIVPFPTESLAGFQSDPLILLPVIVLIILGGLGFMAMSDVISKGHPSRYKLHTKIVLFVTAILITVGTLLYLWFEFDNPNTVGNLNLGDKILNSLFLSVSTRTAGYSTFSLAGLSESSKVLTVILMFIGASPASTGGGIKTTTLFVLVLTILSTVRQKKNTIIDMRKIGKATISRAAAVIMLALTVLTLSVLLLAATDGDALSSEQLLFEQVSAYATVGLSLNATTSLSVLGKLIISLNMFIGRVGVLTFFISFTDRDRATEGKIQYPEANIII